MASAPRGVGVGQDHRELLAADAGDHVELTLVLVQDAGRALERGIADVVAPAVVDLLEVVDVPDHHRDAALAAPGALELEVEQFAKATPVEQPRERVGARGVVELLDQHVGAPAHRADEDRCDDESAHAHHPPRDRAGGRRRHCEQGGVGGAHVYDLGDRLGAGEEVRGVEEDPQVEEDQRARALRREVGDGGDEGRAPRQHGAQRPGGETVGQPVYVVAALLGA